MTAQRVVTVAEILDDPRSEMDAIWELLDPGHADESVSVTKAELFRAIYSRTKVFRKETLVSNQMLELVRDPRRVLVETEMAHRRGVAETMTQQVRMTTWVEEAFMNTDEEN